MAAVYCISLVTMVAASSSLDTLAALECSRTIRQANNQRNFVISQTRTYPSISASMDTDIVIPAAFYAKAINIATQRGSIETCFSYQMAFTALEYTLLRSPWNSRRRHANYA